MHLLVAELAPRGLRRIINQNDWLSLGEVVQLEGEVPRRLQERIVDTLRSFKTIAKGAKADGLYVFATEAVRRAENHQALLDRLEQEVGITVDIIAPEREAELSLRGVQLDTKLPSSSMLIEVGGGSAQVAQVIDHRIAWEESLHIGTGALIAASGLTSPATPEQLARMDAFLEDALDRMPDPPVARSVVASGGVARGLWRALHPDGGRQVHTVELEYIMWATQRLTVPQIVMRFNVKTQRAATLLPGATVYLDLLRKVGQHEMTVSEYGVREGAVMELADGRVQADRV